MNIENVYGNMYLYFSLQSSIVINDPSHFFLLFLFGFSFCILEKVLLPSSGCLEPSVYTLVIWALWWNSCFCLSSPRIKQLCHNTELVSNLFGNTESLCSAAANDTHEFWCVSTIESYANAEFGSQRTRMETLKNMLVFLYYCCCT